MKSNFYGMINRLKKIILASLLLISSTHISWGQVATDTYNQGVIDLWYYLLFLALFLLSVSALIKIIDIYEKTLILKGKKPLDWNKILGIKLIIYLIVGLYGVYWSFAYHGAQILPESASEHGVQLDFLLNLTTVIIMIPFVLAEILLFVFPYMYRYKKNRKASFYHDNHKLEIGWAGSIAVVLITLVSMGFYYWNLIMYPSDEQKARAVKVHILGEQFKWNIRYPGEDNVFGPTDYKKISIENNIGIDFENTASMDDRLASDIVIPVGQPIRLKINSKDVLHSVYMPHFRLQMNAVPGMDTYFQFTPRITSSAMRKKLNNPNFDFILLCAKICGGGHFNMKAKVIVVEQNEYKEWVKKQPFLASEEQRKKKKKVTNTKI